MNKTENPWGIGKKRADVRHIELPAEGRTIVISDIHGNLPLLKGLLAQVGFCGKDTLIILGDIVERSTGSIDTLRYVMELSRTRTVYTVEGNSDAVILAFIDRGEDIPDELYWSFLRRWGERWTAVWMAKHIGVKLAPPRQRPQVWRALGEAFRPELDFLRSLPQIYENENYIFVHGGVPREDRLEELDAHGCMKNDAFLEQGRRFDRWVIVGHWPVTLYRGDIASAAPILDYDRHIASIDGGCTLKLDGQLNALILPREPGGKFTWESYDGFPTAAALDDQAPSRDPVNIRWGRSALEVLEEGPELCLCRHLETGRVLEVLTEYLFRGEGRVTCEDSTDYRLPVTAGDRLTVVRRISDRALCKKDGVTGWYFGRLDG